MKLFIFRPGLEPEHMNSSHGISEHINFEILD